MLLVMAALRRGGALAAPRATIGLVKLAVQDDRGRVVGQLERSSNSLITKSTSSVNSDARSQSNS